MRHHARSTSGTATRLWPRHAQNSWKQSPLNGFTLIELTVTLTVAAVLAFIAIPSFTQMRLNAQLNSAINSALSALNVARAEALRTQGSVYVLPINSAWSNGWRIFVDTNGDGAYTAGTDKLIAQQDALPTAVTITGANTTLTYVRYAGDGYPHQTDSAFLSGQLEMSNGTTSRRLVLSVGGRTAVCDPNAASSTATAATPPC